MDTSAIIDRLGGTKKTADLCGVTLAAVPPWRQTGIPPRHWQAIVEFAREHDIDGITYDTIQMARAAVRGA